MAYQDGSRTSDGLINQLCNVRRGFCGDNGREGKKIWRGTHQIL